jgi:PhzF family phenazine biosynthesis protein
MKIKTFTLDAFTDETFGGNPAAVCIIEEPISEQKMQLIANEINLSETAFITKIEDKNYNIRYFTPTVEIDFCGHATLASAKVILEIYNQPSVEFTTFKNLKVNCVKENQLIKMDFPLYETESIAENKILISALGISIASSFQLVTASNMILIEVASAEELVNLKPNFLEVEKAAQNINGVMVTAKSNDKFDFYSRFFCPWIGINEDPVTGVAHAALAKYWSKKLNKTKLNAFQASKRGGVLNLEIISDSVLVVKGNAVIVFEGIMNI